VIRPLVFSYSSSELRIIIGPTANIDDEKVILVVLVEVAGDIINRIPVGFLEEAGSGIGHSNDATCYVGQVQLLTIKWSFLLRACYDFSND
jgi:hypothetical protein